MEGLNVKLTLASAAVAAALGIPSGPAGAAVYGGFFDPVTFSGGFTIDVDDDCLTSAGFKANSGLPIIPGDGFCSASLTSASADVLGSGGAPNYTGVLDFAPPPISSPGQLFGVFITQTSPGLFDLDSFDTALLPALSETPDDPNNNWAIAFSSGQLCDPYCFSSMPPNAPRGVYLYNDPVGAPVSFTLADTAQYTSVFRIPEPGSLALLLGALGAGLFVGRRPKAVVSNAGPVTGTATEAPG